LIFFVSIHSCYCWSFHY